MSELTGAIFDAKTGKALGTTEHTMSFDSLNITMAGDDKPSVETIRDVRVEFTESYGDTSKSVSVETFATFKELRKLLKELLGGDAE